MASYVSNRNKWLFEYLGNILNYKNEEMFQEHINDPQFPNFPNYMLLRYLSMSRDSRIRQLILENQFTLETLDRISHEKVYRWYMDNIPKQNSDYITYIKGGVKNVNKTVT